MKEIEEKTSKLICAVMIILPFLLFYWIMPFVSSLMMGNDFIYSVHQQMEILFSIKAGSFPLYHPAYALGQSSVVMTWSQVFHPISYLSSIMPGYWNGNAVQWYTFFKLLSLGIAQAALFAFLRQLRLNGFFSFLLSFITVYNLRMLDLFRFGASLEAYMGFLLLCSAIGWYFLRPSRLLGPLSIIVSTYLLVVSGHPQHMYYAMLGTVPFMLVVPYLFSNMLGRHVLFSDVLKFLARTGCFMAVGVLLSAVYIMPFVLDFYATNAGRADATYEWSVANIGLFEMAGNFFMPFFSDVHGAFGGSPITVFSILLPLLVCFRVKIPRPVWAVWGIIAVVILYMLGDMTPIYKVAWKYFPFLSSFRHQGRIAIIVPVYIMLLLAWIVKRDSFTVVIKSFSVKVAPYALLAVTAFVLTPVYLFLYFRLKPYIGEIPPLAINDIPEWIKLALVISGMLSLVCLVLHGTIRHNSKSLEVAILVLTVFHAGVLMRYGTYSAPLEIQPSFKELKAEKELDLGYRSYEVINMHTAASLMQVKKSFMEPFLGRIFTDVITVKTQDEAYDHMSKDRLPHQIFIEGYDSEKATIINAVAKEMKEGKVKLLYSSFNRLQFEVFSQTPAFFGFPYSYTGHWNALVNGEKVKVYRANGASHAVEIPVGKSIVDFRYRSEAFIWGMAITCMTFMLIGVFIYLKTRNGPLGTLALVVFVLLGISGFMLWYKSLYTGTNFKTEYSWTYPVPAKFPNIAYAKKTLGYYPASESLLRLHGSNAVDGDTRPGSGFILRLANDDLIVDLYENHKIKEILLYGEMKTQPVISISSDGIKWQIVTYVKSENAVKSPLHVMFENLPNIRFIKVKASQSELGIDELEVYEGRAI